VGGAGGLGGAFVFLLSLLGMALEGEELRFGDGAWLVGGEKAAAGAAALQKVANRGCGLRCGGFLWLGWVW